MRISKERKLTRTILPSSILRMQKNQGKLWLKRLKGMDMGRLDQLHRVLTGKRDGRPSPELSVLIRGALQRPETSEKAPEPTSRPVLDLNKMSEEQMCRLVKSTIPKDTDLWNNLLAPFRYRPRGHLT